MRDRILECSLAALLVAAQAGAQPPTTAHHRDPDAPGYRWPAVDMDGDGVFDRIDHCIDTKVGCTVDRWGCEADADHDRVCDGRDACPDTPAGMKVDANGCAEGQRDTRSAAGAPVAVTPTPSPVPVTGAVSESERQLVERGRIRLENVYFESGSKGLLPESESSLDEAGSALEKFPDLQIEVEGHTDTRGAAAYNRRLSQVRAEAVRQYLLAHFRLHGDHLTARGYGEAQPETKERNDEELLRNRRVELRVLNPQVLPKSVKVENKKSKYAW